MTYRTCHHVQENGNLCQSAAVTGRDYCWYHLRQRGRVMRMAQARARNRPCPLQLPPLENMYAVQSALTQVMEALAADMIDPKRAQGIVSLLRVAANNLKRPDAWRASEYLNDGSAPSSPLAMNSKPSSACPQTSTSASRPTSPSLSP